MYRRKEITVPPNMKCIECHDWVPDIENNYAFGYCQREGEIVPPVSHLAESYYKFYREEVTRYNDKTRPWHVCDMVVVKLIEREMKEDKKMAGKKKEKIAWTTKQTLELALEDVRKKGVPIPKALEGLDEEDAFPTTNDMEYSNLGRMLFKYAAIKGYIASIVLDYEIEYKNVLHARELFQGQEVSRLEQEAEKKRLKECLQSDAIEGNDNLKKLLKREVILEGKIMKYRGLFDIYCSHWDTVSREISRRDSEMKHGGIYQGE